MQNIETVMIGRDHLLSNKACKHVWGLGAIVWVARFMTIAKTHGDKSTNAVQIQICSILAARRPFSNLIALATIGARVSSRQWLMLCRVAT